MEAVRATGSETPLKLNLGSGRVRLDGFLSIDVLEFPEVDHVIDLTRRWPWADDAVDEVYSSHFFEHLDAEERIHFYNELYRVLKPGATCKLIVPSGSSGRAYGDLTHKWPPVWEFHFEYLDRAWREVNAPHLDARWAFGMLNCDFEKKIDYALHPQLAGRSPDHVRYALTFYKEAAQDIVAVLTKRVPT